MKTAEITKPKKVQKSFSLLEENVSNIERLKKEIENELKEKYGVTKKANASFVLDFLVSKEMKERNLK